MNIRPMATLLAALALLTPDAGANAVLTYRWQHDGQTAIQTVSIQDGMLWITGLGGDPQLETVYDRQREQLALIDHRRQRITPIDAASVGKLAGYLEDIAPLLRGMSGQIQRLSPEQRKKWAGMLGDFPLDAFDIARKELEHTQLKSADKPKAVAGIPCHLLRLSSGKTTGLDLCLATPEALNLNADDTQTLAALSRLSQRLAGQAQAIAARFGLALGRQDLERLSGVPVAVRELKGHPPRTLELERVQTVTSALKKPEIPEGGYQVERLRLW